MSEFDDLNQKNGVAPRRPQVSVFRNAAGAAQTAAGSAPPTAPHVPPATTPADPPPRMVFDPNGSHDTPLSSTAPVLVDPARVRDSLTPLPLDAGHMAANGLFLDPAQNPVTQTFDILRTRILNAMAQNGWSRLAITSPTHGCGKSFVTANLALSLGRLTSSNTILLDLELRAPELFRLFGLDAAPSLQDYLEGDGAIMSHFYRIGRNLALGLNGTPVTNSAELMQSTTFGEALDTLTDRLRPDLLLFDTPPALGSDDVLALAQHCDAVLLVADGTMTAPEDITASERLFKEADLPLLGVVLNRARDRNPDRYGYGRR